MQQRTYTPAVNAMTMGDGRTGTTQRSETMDWSGEISPLTQLRPPLDTGMGGMSGDLMSGGMQGNIQSGMQGSMQDNHMQNNMQGSMQNNQMQGNMHSGMQDWNQNGMQTRQSNTLDMRHNLSDDVIESPMSNAEVYAGSTKAMLRRNLGNYVVATFLVGTQNTVSWEGILYDVGNDYVTIYQPGRDRYIVNDIYSLRYTEFYDVRRRQLCDQLMRDQGWDVGETWPPSR